MAWCGWMDGVDSSCESVTARSQECRSICTQDPRNRMTVAKSIRGSLHVGFSELTSPLAFHCPSISILTILNQIDLLVGFVQAVCKSAPQNSQMTEECLIQRCHYAADSTEILAQFIGECLFFIFRNCSKKKYALRLLVLIASSCCIQASSTFRT